MPSPMRSACASRCQRRPKKSGAPCRTRACRRRPNRETLPMYAFEYHRPTSVADAVSLLKRAGDGVRIAVTGAGPCVFRASDMESALAGNFAASALDGIKVKPDGLNSDIHASAEYRAHLVKVMAQRAVAA